MKDEQFKPYIPADKITPEFTVTSVIMGMLLAVVFGAANACSLRIGSMKLFQHQSQQPLFLWVLYVSS